jgi:hypothetical protein
MTDRKSVKRNGETARQIRLPYTLESHIREIENNLSTEAQQYLIKDLPINIFNLGKRSSSNPFMRLIEYAIYHGIKTVREELTPNVPAYDPYEGLEAFDRTHRHWIELNLTVIAQATKRQPQLASLLPDIKKYRPNEMELQMPDLAKGMELQKIVDLVKEYESHLNEINKLKRENAELKKLSTSPPG